MTRESSDSINEGENDLQVLLEKQDTQFRALTEVLKDFLNNLGFALGNSVSKRSKSIEEKIDKLNSIHNSGQLEDLNRERLENDASSSDPNGTRRVGPAKLPGNPNKKRIISQDDDSLSLFAPSEVEKELQQEEDNPLRKVMFVVNDTEPQSEGHTDDILCELTEEFNNDEICDPKINTNLAKAINEVWGKKLTPEKLKIRLNKHLKPENCDQLSPTLVNMEIFSNISAHIRSQGVKLQKMQKFLLKSAYPIVKILDNILTNNSSNNKPDHMLINKIKELASDALAVLSQSSQELLQQRPDAITKNVSREYETLKHNVPLDSKQLFSDDLNNRIKLLQASNEACKVNITPNNSRCYQTYSPNFSQNQENSISKTFKVFSGTISTKTPFQKKLQQGQGNKHKF